MNKKEFLNKKARFDYQILDSLEAGIILTGMEIKALRAGRVNITGSYAKVINDEVFWLGGVIQVDGEDHQRTRKLLLNKGQIKKLIGLAKEKGLALLPLKVYFKKGRAKMELGIGRGLKKYDKRERVKKREVELEQMRIVKNY